MHEPQQHLLVAVPDCERKLDPQCETQNLVSLKEQNHHRSPTKASFPHPALLQPLILRHVIIQPATASSRGCDLVVLKVIMFSLEVMCGKFVHSQVSLSGYVSFFGWIHNTPQAAEIVRIFGSRLRLSGPSNHLLKVSQELWMINNGNIRRSPFGWDPYSYSLETYEDWNWLAIKSVGKLLLIYILCSVP